MIGGQIEALRNTTGSPRGSLRFSLHRREPADTNATGLPRGFLRSSLGKASANDKREAPRDKPLTRIVCGAPSLATIHGTSPWHSPNRKVSK
jgi:hypothetical protein